MLFLGHNKLASIPPCIVNLEKMYYLSLNGNKYIQHIPPELKKSRQIEYLDLRNNTLVDLPEDIVHLERLKTLYLEHNPLCVGNWQEKHAESLKKMQIRSGIVSGCSKQCSPYCSSYLRTVKVCLRECNNGKCDQGLCWNNLMN